MSWTKEGILSETPIDWEGETTSKKHLFTGESNAPVKEHVEVSV